MFQEFEQLGLVLFEWVSEGFTGLPVGFVIFLVFPCGIIVFVDGGIEGLGRVAYTHGFQCSQRVDRNRMFLSS